MTNPSPECDHRSMEKDWRDADYINAARAIASAHGQDPDEEAPRSEMCNDDNSTVPWFMVFMEDAEAALDAVAPPAHQENSPRSAPEPAPQVREALARAHQNCLALWEALEGGPSPRCRDCADFNGRCQGNGLPCDPQERALERVKLLRAALTPVVAREPVGWRWPRALNVTRSVHNHWHGDISFARSPTDKELRNLDEFLNAHHINASPPPASAVREATIKECAKICDGLRRKDYSAENGDWVAGTTDCARAIRALSKGTADESTKTIG